MLQKLQRAAKHKIYFCVHSTDKIRAEAVKEAARTGDATNLPRNKAEIRNAVQAARDENRIFGHDDLYNLHMLSITCPSFLPLLQLGPDTAIAVMNENSTEQVSDQQARQRMGCHGQARCFVLYYKL